jgi:hypothetical protein
VPGEINDDDSWEVIHNHPGGNMGWENAVKLFKRFMPEMAAFTEALATALGAPFLRADFFVGSQKWGVRLNEVAYGCGLDYRTILKEGTTQRVIDDKPAMVEILRQGMERCTKHMPARHFLQTLGLQGTEYADSAVTPLKTPAASLPRLPIEITSQEWAEMAAEEALCKSMKELPPHEEEVSKDQIQIPKPSAHIPTVMMPTRLLAMSPVQPLHVITSNPAQILGCPPSSLKLHTPGPATEVHKARANACGITMAAAQPRATFLLRAPPAR